MNNIRVTKAIIGALPAAEWILCLLLLLLFAGRGLRPAWRTLNTDFPNYYLMAVIRRQHTPADRDYEWIWFQRQKDHHDIAQPLVGFVPNPPLCAAPMLPLASLPALTAKRAWIMLNLAFLSVALCILHGLTQLQWRRIFLIAGLCIVPLRTNFVLGQYYIVILLLICLAYFAFVRGHHATAGAFLAAGAWLKLFPALFLILFLRKRQWRAALGLVVAGLALAGVSVIIFGVDVHRVWIFEVLPRAFRGDMIDPFDLQWSSFSALWHRLFLFQPELNPAPVLRSPFIYALLQALTSTALLFAFLFLTNDSSDGQTTAWEWAAFIPLLLLLSSMSGSYHYVILIFTLIVTTDLLIRTRRWHIALVLLVLYAVACAPLPGGGLFLLRRLVTTVAFYMVILWNTPAGAGPRTRKILWAMAALVFVTLFTVSLRTLKNRDEDFLAHVSNIKDGYASFNPIATSRGIASIQMINKGYRAIVASDGGETFVSVAGDVLSIASSTRSRYIYFEMVDRGSHVLRLASEKIGQPEAMLEYVTEGQQPAVSYDGRWLAFLREDHGQTTIWRSHDGSEPQNLKGTPDQTDVLEMTITNDGDIIAATGSAASPHLSLLPVRSGEEKSLYEIGGAVRYPAVSPDSARLAFSRRETGSWHLFVRDLSTGTERRLTSGACNASSAAWEDSRTLLYATDCGRGYGLGAVARIVLNE